MIRDTLASLEGRLDDVRRRQAWRAIEQRLRAEPERARRRWPWLVVPAIALTAAAATIASISRSPDAAEPCVVVPSVSEPVAPPAPPPAPPAALPAAPPAAPSMPIPPPETPPAVTAVKPRPSIARSTAQPRVATAGPSAAELYRLAEAALASHDTASARAHLTRLLREHPGAKQVDQARYDLALLAHDAGDDNAAAALLDAILESGTDDAVRAAAAQLRRRVR
jgi:TolA-binding protein